MRIIGKFQSFLLMENRSNNIGQAQTLPNDYMFQSFLLMENRSNSEGFDLFNVEDYQFQSFLLMENRSNQLNNNSNFFLLAVSILLINGKPLKF